MRLAGQIAKKVSLFAGSLVKPGVTLDWIDKTVLVTLDLLTLQTHEYALSLGYYPSCLGKDGFPKSISISVNEVVCHAIPDDTVLENGDIVKIDLVMYAAGFHGDTCRTFPCGEVDEKGLHLIETTQKCLDAGIKVCKPGQDYFQIGRAIQQLANQEGFNVYFFSYSYADVIVEWRTIVAMESVTQCICYRIFCTSTTDTEAK